MAANLRRAWFSHPRACVLRARGTGLAAEHSPSWVYALIRSHIDSLVVLEPSLQLAGPALS